MKVDSESDSGSGSGDSHNDSGSWQLAVVVVVEVVPVHDFMQAACYCSHLSWLVDACEV